MILNALVTAHARIFLDQHCRKLTNQPNTSILYVDTGKQFELACLPLYNFFLLDSIIFTQPSDVVPDLPIHQALSGYFKNEVPKGQRIKNFICLSAKNYTYDLENEQGLKVDQIVKMKGFTIRSKTLKNQFTIDYLKDFIDSMQRNEHKSVYIRQRRLDIHSVKKTISEKTIYKIYKNFTNEKRWYNSKLHKTRLFEYGCQTL